MSISSTRTALEGALDAATGVQFYERPPSTPRTGDAFGFWSGAIPPDRGAYALSFAHEWQVHIVVPADPVAADEWVEAHLEDVVDAVADVLAISSIQPGKIPAGKSTSEYNALIITGRTE